MYSKLFYYPHIIITLFVVDLSPSISNVTLSNVNEKPYCVFPSIAKIKCQLKLCTWCYNPIFKLTNFTFIFPLSLYQNIKIVEMNRSIAIAYPIHFRIRDSKCCYPSFTLNKNTLRFTKCNYKNKKVRRNYSSDITKLPKTVGLHS